MTVLKILRMSEVGQIEGFRAEMKLLFNLPSFLAFWDPPPLPTPLILA